MEEQENIWSIMTRCLFGEAQPEEETQLSQYFQSHPELQQQYDFLYQMFGRKVEEAPDMAAEDYATDLHSIISKANQMETPGLHSITPQRVVKRKILSKAIWAAAAVMVLAVGLSWQYFGGSPKKTAPLKLALTTLAGSRKQLILPDGSTVWLNAGSSLYYVNDFKGATREVQLEGEAFFDIVKNPKKPFLVHAGPIDIKVLGTAFNVKAYKGDPDVVTSLYRGLISVTNTDVPKNTHPILVYPNQKLIVPNQGRLPTEPGLGIDSDLLAIKIEPLDSVQKETDRMETAWMYNRLAFRGDDFETLARKMENWYNLKIQFTDEPVKQLHFNGSFEGETIAQALKALQMANSFNYKIVNNEIFIGSSR